MEQRRNIVIRLAAACCLVALAFLLNARGVSAEVTRDQFVARTAADLVALCSTSKDDPHYQAAIGFCYGYGVGAFHYYHALASRNEGEKFVCLQEGKPGRAEILRQFVAWSKEHSQYMADPPVEALFRFLAQTWPCPE